MKATRKSAGADRGKERIGRIRKIQGFVIQFEGHQALVMLLGEDKSAHQYHLPARKLKAAGVRVQNQPFELKETQVYPSGKTKPIYRVEFRALASADSATMTKLDLGPEYEKKLKRIQAYFSGRKENRQRH